MIAFGILYFLLNKYAFDPLFGIMEQRKQIVLADLQQAEMSRQEAAKFLEEQRQLLEAARIEVAQLKEQATVTTAKLTEQMIEEAKAEAQRIQKDALLDIMREKSQAIDDVRQQVGQLAILIATKLIEKEIDAKAQRTLVENLLREVKLR
jgi:F-type H+-transporting ATPase subunit b